MIRRLLAGLALAAGLALLPSAASAQVTGRGTEFWACWPRSHLSLETSAEVIVMADAPTLVQIDGAFLAGPVSVGPGTPWIVGIPPTLRMAGERTVLPVGFRIRTLDATKPIIVTLRVPRQAEASDDTARLLPVAELGTRYVVASYPASLPGEPSLYAVIATEDGTTLNADVLCAGVSDTVTLNRGETYQVFCDWRDTPNDVSGAIVTADKPVAVFGGNSDAFVPTDWLSGDFILEQLPPVSSWGTDFYVAPLPKGPNADPGAHDVVRLICDTDGTAMADEGAGPLPRPLLAHKPADFTPRAPLHVTTDVPCDAYQFATGVEMTDLGDPFMTEVPAVSHWGIGARAWIPPYYSLGTWLTLVTDTASTASARVDGAAVTGWLPLPGGTHSYALVDAGSLPGERVVACDSPIGVIVHGYNDTYLPDPALGRTPGSHGTPAAHAVPPCAIVPVIDVPSTSCLGATLHLHEAGSTASGCTDLEYRWLQDGTPIPGCDFGTTGDCDVIFRGDSTYALEVRCATNHACSGIASQRVINDPPPQVAIQPNPVRVCAGGRVRLTAPDGFLIYAWSSSPTDPGVTPRSSALPFIDATPDVDTTYTVTAFDGRGCASVANVSATVIPDPLPPALGNTVRVTKTAADTIITWQDDPGTWGGYEVVDLDCPTRDWRASCGSLAPDPVTIQASPLAGARVPPGTQALTHVNALNFGDLIFYKVRATSACNFTPGPTCNPWPHQIPPCP